MAKTPSRSKKTAKSATSPAERGQVMNGSEILVASLEREGVCLLYTSDAADE